MYFVYSVLEDEVKGPYSEIDLVDFIEPGMCVYDEGIGEWKYSEEIPRLKELLTELGLLQNYVLVENDFYINDSGEIIRSESRETISTPNRVSQTVENINYTKEESNLGCWIFIIIAVAVIVIIANS